MNDAIIKLKLILGEEFNCRQNGFVTDIKRKIWFFLRTIKGLCLNDDITICRKGSVKGTLIIDIYSIGVRPEVS